MRLLAFAVTSLSIVAGPLVAADLNLADLRFGAGILSNEYKGSSSTTVTSNGGGSGTTTNSGDSRNADSNYRGQLQWIGGHLGAGGGFIYGIGVAVNHATWDNGSQDAHATTPVADLMLGYGYAFTPQWHFEIMPFAGYGQTYYSVSDSNSSSTNSDWHHYWEYGGKVGTYVALTPNFTLGVEVPYLIGRFDPDYDYNDAANSFSVSDERRNEGFGVLVTLGGRF